MIRPECRSFVDALVNRDLVTAKSLCTPANVNAPCAKGGWTALHVVAEHGVLEAARFLLENGASPNQTDDAGWTPLHLSLDADIDSYTQTEPPGGAVPPTFAMAALLLSCGADPNARTKKGRAPLDLATGHPKAIELLKRYGATSSS
jgi:ankyrin repeat protein